MSTAEAAASAAGSIQDAVTGALSSTASTLASLLSHPSFLFLDEQVARGTVPKAQADNLKTRFADLYRQAALAVERERDSLASARDLRTQVREEQIALERARIHKEQVEALSEAADSERRKVGWWGWRASRAVGLCAPRCAFAARPAQLAHSLNELESRETGLQIELNEQRSLEVELQVRASLRRGC